MKDRLKQAAEEAIILGVKFSLVLLLLAFVANDYWKTRTNAIWGNAAREYLLQGVQAGKLPADWNPKPQAPPIADGGAKPIPTATPLSK